MPFPRPWSRAWGLAGIARSMSSIYNNTGAYRDLQRVPRPHTRGIQRLVSACDRALRLSITFYTWTLDVLLFWGSVLHINRVFPKKAGYPGSR